MVAIPKRVREKLGVKEENLLTCLDGCNGYVKIEIGF
jgi:hypothetical protein